MPPRHQDDGDTRQGEQQAWRQAAITMFSIGGGLRLKGENLHTLTFSTFTLKLPMDPQMKYTIGRAALFYQSEGHATINPQIGDKMGSAGALTLQHVKLVQYLTGGGSPQAV